MTKQYDIIFISGEIYFDHPLSGIAILKRYLEKYEYSVGIIIQPKDEKEILKLGEAKLFFAISSGAIDSMVRNFTPLKKLRIEDNNLDYSETVPNRAVITYSNWIRRQFPKTKMILGGTEASLRRFAHYDYWDNKVRKPILFDSRADLLVYGYGEKQILEIANRLKANISSSLDNIDGTCIITKEIPEIKDLVVLPEWNEVSNNDEKSKIKFCEMTNKINVNKNIIQKIDNRYILQYHFPEYNSKDLDEIYDLPFTREVKHKHLEGFIFSVVTHRGCIGNCSFCSISQISGNRLVSRSKDSILKEIKKITQMPHFRGNIDDLGGPSANMYGIDCINSLICNNDCLTCNTLNKNKSNKKWIELLREARQIKGVKKVYIRSGLRYDLIDKEFLKELMENHIFNTLRIAPEHISTNVLKLMNKNKGNLNEFIKEFEKIKNTANRKYDISFYFITAHPGSSMKEAKELSNFLKKTKNAETVQIFTPTPMTISTCMYWTGINPKTMEKIYVPHTYNEKKEQKRILFEDNNSMKNYKNKNNKNIKRKY
jgi:uncharacterized radical SAM protein YgiQ